jgi:hypothetical protein
MKKNMNYLFIYKIKNLVELTQRPHGAILHMHSLHVNKVSLPN